MICKTFDVNYEWLITGKGDIFVETKEDTVEKLSEKLCLGETAKKIIGCYLKLDEEQRETIDDFIMDVAKSLVVDEAIERADLYRAADSETHTEHEIITDDKRTVEKLKKCRK